MKNNRILVFGGTLEGRTLTGRLLQCGYSVTCSVATDYGRELLQPQKELTILTGRMEADGMQRLMEGQGFDCVVDATHPYATEVSKNIRLSADTCGLQYYRLTRPAEKAEDVLWADSPRAAARLLSELGESALLTTGSKDLSVFATVPTYEKRLWVRILPAVTSLQLALQAGFPSEHIICMQGPFSVELNVAMLRQTGCTILVTKDTGRAGGFLEKAEAARLAGARLLVIRRPVEESGFTLEELTDRLCKYPGGSDRR